MIGFFDTEVNENSQEIENYGSVFGDEEDGYEYTSLDKILQEFQRRELAFICGHNFINHDKKFLEKTSFAPLLKKLKIIDTLYLSMLLFPHKRTHKLKKPYKSEINVENQPLGDALQTRELLHVMDSRFDGLDEQLRQIYYELLGKNEYFSGYFAYKDMRFKSIDIYKIVKERVECDEKEFLQIQKESPAELAFCIAFLYTDKRASISWILLNSFPKITKILRKISFNKQKIDLTEFSKEEFGIPSFREFEGASNSLFEKKISQEDIIKAGLDHDKSLLAILPTGGGKTFTFLMPALLKAEAYKGLSVVISPLQALMKDQVESFGRKNHNFKVAAISGFLSPIERLNTINEVQGGVVDVLYLAPEALRSNVIFNSLKRRIIERFIIDEAHCFSSWGHDFRHDYFFIAHTIKELEESAYQPKIPISCFSATAKKEVIRDIGDYLFKHLGVKLKKFIASSQRKNLNYEVIEVLGEREKHEALVKLLQEIQKEPTIIYLPQNARGCKKLSENLKEDVRIASLDLEIEPFYAKIDKDIEDGKRVGRNKTEILDGFIDDKIDIIIATTAFGMGIDKPNIKNVIHYEQSDSLEAYLQESGRGARDEKIEARCVVLYAKSDFNKNFINLNRGKVDYHEITSVVKELKKMKKKTLYLSPKQLAMQMGIDTEDSSKDYETMIKTALLELEHADIIKRRRDKTSIFATSIDKEKRSMEYVHKVLDPKKAQYDKLYSYMIQVMQNIIQRSKVDAIGVDDLSSVVGIDKKIVFSVLYALRDEGLIDFKNDISAFVKKNVYKEMELHFEYENIILEYFLNSYSPLDLRELNGSFEDNINHIAIAKKIIQSWTHLSKLQLNIFNANFKRHNCFFEIKEEDTIKLKKLIHIRQHVCKAFVAEILMILGGERAKEIEFCSNKILSELKTQKRMQKMSLEAFHHSIVYLSELTKSFQLRRGRLIYYQTYNIEKKENINNHKPYLKGEHYDKGLKEYYKRKIAAIHILIGFLESILSEGWEKTKSFASDYFTLEYKKFIKKYKFEQNELSRAVTKERYEEIIYNLNEEQSKILHDNKSNAIMVLAGPGSGKTKTLVHKIASLITLENHKNEYFLMLAHSRSAVGEFKSRLKDLIGNLVYDVQIFTFHAYALYLLGKNIKDDKQSLKEVIEKATKLLNEKKISMPYTQMLVLDEYQDVGEKTYNFIKAIYNQMSDERKIIAVGDDDQCINNFGDDRANIAYISRFSQDFKDLEEKNFLFSKYDLTKNYRSCQKIVDFANEYAKNLKGRLKQNRLVANSKDKGSLVLTGYKNTSPYFHIAKLLKEDLNKTKALLARTNDEVLEIYSYLVSENIKVSYINQKDGFELGCLEELCYFLENFKYLDVPNSFEVALGSVEENFRDSSNFALAKKVIDRFWQENGEENIKNFPQHYVGVFEEYLKEIKFEDFIHSNIIISTMHKAKGKEFDSVYLCIKDNLFLDEYSKRLFYVAITRAKKHLSLHVKEGMLLSYRPFFDTANRYEGVDKELESIVFVVGLGDIFLSSPKSANGIEQTKPMAGEFVDIFQNEDKFFIYKNGIQISQLSQPKNDNKVSKKILQRQNLGYRLMQKAQIEYIVLWTSQEDKKSYKQVLCKIFMKKDRVL